MKCGFEITRYKKHLRYSLCKSNDWIPFRTDASMHTAFPVRWIPILVLSWILCFSLCLFQLLCAYHLLIVNRDGNETEGEKIAIIIKQLEVRLWKVLWFFYVRKFEYTIVAENSVVHYFRSDRTSLESCIAYNLLMLVSIYFHDEGWVLFALLG